MKAGRWFGSALVIALAMTAVAAGSARAAGSLRIDQACESGESWAGLPPVARDLERAARQHFLSQRPAAALLAEGLLLRRLSTEDETRSLSEYAIARSLQSEGQVHASLPLFEAILQQSPDSPAASASLRCLNRDLRGHPSLELGNPAAASLRALESRADAAEIDEFVFRAGLQSGGTFSKRWLEQGGDSDWKHLARAMQSANRKPEDVVNQLAPVFARAAKDPVGLSLLAQPFRAFVDRARLLHSRALYELGRFEESARVLRDLRRQSNELVSGLQELAWAQLLAGKPADAVGTALGFQAGGLARVFAPESWMVMGMAFMELCRYPEARRAVDRLRESYGATAEWLAAHAGKSDALYPLAIETLRRDGKSTAAPAPVSSEWIRSPVFQELQREIQLGREEAGRESKLSEGAVSDLKRIALKIAETSSKILAERQDRDRRRPDLVDQPLRSESVKELRALVRDYRVLRGTGPIADAILKRQSALRSTREPRFVAMIEKDLRERTERMRAVLTEVAANARLIEVELLQGASRELVLTNARGESPRAPAVAAGRPSSEGWNWGRRRAFTGASEEREELWEDEIGAFQAEVSDRCS